MYKKLNKDIFYMAIFIICNSINILFGRFFYNNISLEIEKFTQIKENYLHYFYYFLSGIILSLLLEKFFKLEFLDNFYYFFMKENDKEKDKHLIKLREKTFLFFLYLFNVMVYIIFGQNSYYIPSMLGGNDLTIEYLEKNMFIQLPNNGLLFIFYFQIGHHFLRSYQHIKNGGSNFVTLVIHHNITIYLMIYTCFFRYYFIGMNISFLHDIGDIFWNLAKFFYEVNYKKIVQIFTMILFFLSWIVTRDYLFLFVVYFKIFYVIFLSKSNHINALFLRSWNFGVYSLTYSILSILVILNFIWTHKLIYGLKREFTKMKKIN